MIITHCKPTLICAILRINCSAVFDLNISNLVFHAGFNGDFEIVMNISWSMIAKILSRRVFIMYSYDK